MADPSLFPLSGGEWPLQGLKSADVAKATAGVLMWGYGQHARSEAESRLTAAMDELDLETARIWYHVLALLTRPADDVAASTASELDLTWRGAD